MKTFFFFFISKRMTHELRGVKCFSILAIFSLLSTFCRMELEMCNFTLVKK